jgi:hypothetical protein
MAKLILDDIASGYGTTTKINSNNAAIETAMENTLSRDGTSPNNMLSNLDMNSYRITNLGAPSNDQDAARLVDLRSSYSFAILPSAVGQTGKAIVSDGTNPTWQVVLTSASNLNASLLASGTVPDARFPATLPAASGINLTALNGTNIASGTVAAARLPATLAYKDATSNFTVGLQVTGLDVGTKDVPVVVYASGIPYGLTLTDRGKIVSSSLSGWNVPLFSAQAFAVGTTITLYNNSAGTLVLTATAGVTVRIAGTATGGSGVSRNIAQRGLVTIVNVATNEWVASGGGLS